MEDPVLPPDLDGQRRTETDQAQASRSSQSASNNQDQDWTAASTSYSNSTQSPDSNSMFSDLPLSALTATSTSSPSSSVYPLGSTPNANFQRPLSAISTNSSSKSTSASPSSSPNVSRSSSIGQSSGVKSGGRIRPGLLSRAGTDPDRDGTNLLGGNGTNGSGIKPLSSISQGLPSALSDGSRSDIRNLSRTERDSRRNVAMRSASASEDDEARLSDSGIIPRRFAHQPLSNSNSSLNVAASSINSAPAATTSMDHPQRSTTLASSTYSGYSASSSRSSSPLVSPASSISAARARQVFASPTSSPISSTTPGLPTSPPATSNSIPGQQNLSSFSNHSRLSSQYYSRNEPTSGGGGGHVSEASSKSGSASLGRAQSVSSVSSVNSTSSLEAAPFRAPPLGNFRVGFGGYGRAVGYGNSSTSNNNHRRPSLMSRDKTLSGGNQTDKSVTQNASRVGMAIGTGGESSAAESEDGGNEPSTGKREKNPVIPNRSNASGDFQHPGSEMRAKEREVLPSSSSPAQPFGLDPASISRQEAESGASQVPPPPRKQAHTPKLPSDAWQYRNAPGMGGSRHNSSIPASWGLMTASGAGGKGHQRGSNSLSIPQSNTWSVGSSSGVEGSIKTIDLGNEELLAANSSSHSPSRKHPNSSTFRSKLVKSASKLGIKPLNASATGGSGGSSPSGTGGSRPFIQLEGEALPEASSLKIDTAPSVVSNSSGGGLLVPSAVGTPLSAGALSSSSAESTLGLAGLVGLAPSINSQDDSLPMSRTSSVTNAPLFVAKHGEGVGSGSGMNFNNGSISPLPSPGIPAYVNTSKNAFGVWAFGVPEPRVSPKEEREKLMPTSSSASASASASNLSTSPVAIRSIGGLSASSLAPMAPSSPLRTPNSALSPSTTPASNSKALDTPSPETPTTPLSATNASSSGATPIPSKKNSASLTPAQQVQAEAEAGTARAPSEPSGHTPGPTPVLISGTSSSRDKGGRNRSSNRDKERESIRETPDQIRKGHRSTSRNRVGSPSPSTSPTPKPTSPIARPQELRSESRTPFMDVSKTRQRERTNSSNLKSQPSSSSDTSRLRKRDSATPLPASAPTSPSLEPSRFNLHKQSNSTSSGTSHATEDSSSSAAAASRGRIGHSHDGSNPPVKQRPLFLRALTSESFHSNRSSKSKNGSVLSGEGSWGSGSTSRPAGKREEDARLPSALARTSQAEEGVQQGMGELAKDVPSETVPKEKDRSESLQMSLGGQTTSREAEISSLGQDSARVDALLTESRPVTENSVNMAATLDDPKESGGIEVDHSSRSEPQVSSQVSTSSIPLNSESSCSGPKSSTSPEKPQQRAKLEVRGQVQAPPSSSPSLSGAESAKFPQIKRAETSISTYSNAVSSSSSSVAPISIKAPGRELPGLYIPHNDPSSDEGVARLAQSSEDAGPIPGETAASISKRLDSPTPSTPPPTAVLNPAPLSTGASPLAPPTPAPASASKLAGQSPTTPAATQSPRTARGPKDFEFGEILGEGSYSTVLEAWDLLSGPSNGSVATQSTTAAAAAAGKTSTSSATAARAGKKMYAVKVLDKMHILKEKKQKYVNVEREALSLLVKHPGVISLYWTFQDRESLYFVLQLAQNGELLTFIKKYGSFDPHSTRYYAAQLIDTIGAMHRVGVIHRDIKPENVLLDGAMRIKVTDFGSAKISKPTSSTSSSSAAASPANDTAAPVKERANSFVGTAEYVSPELLGGKAAAEASDFWAFGCVLYQMIAGRPPFKGANEYQTFQKIIKREFEYPEEFPADARDLVDRLLVLDPEKRFGFRGGVEEIKKHAFFSEIDFNTIWSIPAPPISTGIYQRPAPSITRGSQADSLFGSDGWADSREAGSLISQGNSSLAPSTGNAPDGSGAASVSSAERASSSATPARSITSVADADDSDSDAQAGPRRPRGLSTGEVGASGANGKKASNLLRLATAVTGKEWSATVGSRTNRNSQRASVIPPNARHQLKHTLSSNEPNNASSSSVDDFDQDETPTRGVPPRRRHGSAAVMAPSAIPSASPQISANVVGWAALLLPHEVLLYACPVIHRKTGTANMFSKKRQLILTDFPRLLCVKETADALKVKSEVILAMPQLVSPSSQISNGMADTAAQPAELGPNGLTPDVPSRFEAKRRASQSSGVEAPSDQQPGINGASRGIPTRRESWSANSLAVEAARRGNSPDPERERASAFVKANANAAPNMLIAVEARGNRAFVVHTPARSYLYEDPSGDSSNWIKVINSARGS